jgi:D-alanyl-D-alanine carboxypeptidase
MNRIELEQYIKQYNRNFCDTSNYNFPLFAEAKRLKKCKKDMFDRDVYLDPKAKKAWKKMKKAANKVGIKLKIISAFRSYNYQKQLIQNKLDKGLSKEEILKVNTLPGYSEHHTGCAIDIGAKNEAILDEEFDQTEAFDWLQQNAEKFGFFMSYPKKNTTGICYEPWHWCYRK